MATPIEPILVNKTDAAALLGLKDTVFRHVLPQLKARHGLRAVLAGGRERYVVKSLKAIVEHCEKTGDPLYEADRSYCPKAAAG